MGGGGGVAVKFMGSRDCFALFCLCFCFDTLSHISLCSENRNTYCKHYKLTTIKDMDVMLSKFTKTKDQNFFFWGGGVSTLRSGYQFSLFKLREELWIWKCYRSHFKLTNCRSELSHRADCKYTDNRKFSGLLYMYNYFVT